MEPIETIDIGNTVICDWCGVDYTNSDAKGGVLFGSRGCCPVCEPEVVASAKRYNETNYIKGYCPEGMTFREWILQLRGGDNTIKFFGANSVEELFGELPKKL